jgi:creatinine amidohydrolase
MRYGDLTYLEIRDRAVTGALAIVPTGCTEQQGPHLPVDFDTWLAETVCLAGAQRAAERYGVQAFVLPALPFGPTPEHRAYGSGYVHLPQSVHEAAIRSVLESLAEQGFRQIVVWRGCGGHDLEQTIARFNATRAGLCSAVLPELPYHEIWCRVGDARVPGGHADSFSTSLALYLRPAAVRRALIENPRSAPVDWDDPELDFRRYSASGVIGDPTHSSAALGRRLWVAVVERVAERLGEIAGKSSAAQQDSS